MHILMAILGCDKTTAELLARFIFDNADQPQTEPTLPGVDTITSSTSDVSTATVARASTEVAEAPAEAVKSRPMSTEDNAIPDVMASAAVIAYADVGDRAAAIEPTCVSEREPGSEMDTALDGAINATANASTAFVRDGQSQDIATLADAVFQAKHPAPGARPGEMALFTGSYAKMLTPPEKPECDGDTGSHGPWLINEIGDEFSSVKKYSPSLAAPKNATCT
jgi:hypothetical protein